MVSRAMPALALMALLVLLAASMWATNYAHAHTFHFLGIVI